ncbi:MAG: hypothetical protein ABRQ38_30240 [Candidatus Eremiobacterota bacterium]
MTDKAFDYAKEITVTVLETKAIDLNCSNPAERIGNFFETLYKKLKELESTKN